MLAISFLLKLSVYFNSLQFSTFENVALFANIFVLMTGVFFGIRLFKSQQKEATSYIDDFKAGMRIAAVYALLMSIFLYVYYAHIDPTYFEIKLQNQLEAAQNQENIDLAKAQEMGEFILSPYFQSTVSLLGFLILGSFYSALIAFLVRKFSGFRHP
jgi:amino acid transporter